MRKYALALIISICTLGLGARLLAATSGRAVIAVMQFHPSHSDHWGAENEVDIEDVDHDHFVFNDDHSIDMNLLRDDTDLAAELTAKGKDEVVAQIVRGQNMINDVFSVGQTKVIDVHLDRKSDISVLTLHTKQDLPDGTYERVEKYFIGVGQTLHAELRWKSDADSKAVKQARADFEDGKFSLAGGKEAAK